MRHRLTAVLLASLAAMVAACSDSGTGPEPEPNPPIWSGRWTDTTAGVRAVLTVPVRVPQELTYLALTRLADDRTEYYAVHNITLTVTTPPRIDGELRSAQTPTILYERVTGTLVDANAVPVEMGLLVPRFGSVLAQDSTTYSLTKQP